MGMYELPFAPAADELLGGRKSGSVGWSRSGDGFGFAAFGIWTPGVSGKSELLLDAEWPPACGART